MIVALHNARQYADSLQSLLPLGSAWVWAPGSFGDELVLSTAQELARLDAGTQLVMDEAIELHRPALSSYTLHDYQTVADANTQVIIRKPAAIGKAIGYRLWSHWASPVVDPAPEVELSVVNPFVIGGHIGDGLWTVASRYYIRVKYDRSLIKSGVVNDALMLFKQAHVYLLIIDVPNLYNNPFYPFRFDSIYISYDDPTIRWY